jgi:hypothetical protein
MFPQDVQLQRLQHSLYNWNCCALLLSLLSWPQEQPYNYSMPHTACLIIIAVPAAVLPTGENVQLQQACLVASYRALHADRMEGVQECGLRIRLPGVRVPVPTCGQCDRLL